MSDKTLKVTTIKGDVVERLQCRYIQKQYYKINRDCFKMPDGKWHRVGNGKIDFDHELGEYSLLDKPDLLNGIIGFKEGNPITGMFTKNMAKNVNMYNRGYCISEKVAKEGGYEECLSNNSFYRKGRLSREVIESKSINSRYDLRLDYGAQSSLEEFKDYHNKYFQSQKPDNEFFDELGDATFGVEFETDNGIVASRHLYKLGLIPLRDGSLRHDGIEPYEYSTIPLSGQIGAKTLLETVEILQKYTTISDRCALHVHIGNYAPSKEFTVALHRLGSKLQNELYSLFPSNYKYTSENGFKSKDYCAPLPRLRLLKNASVDQNFNTIFNHYSYEMEEFGGFGVRNHPRDRGGNRKWEIEKRYRIINTIPLIWGPSGTVEYRVNYSPYI